MSSSQLRNRLDTLQRMLHRYDNFFAFDLPPQEPRASEVKLPMWMLMH